MIAVGSLKVGTSPDGADGAAGAGEGVEGIFDGAEDVVDCAGAGGADGVCAEAELGVEGTALLVELAGGAFGLFDQHLHRIKISMNIDRPSTPYTL